MKIHGILIAVALFFASSTVAQMPEFREVDHYRVIPTPFETTDVNSDTVVVTEMFSYSCIHCYNFEDLLTEWRERQSENVKFEREHVVFSAAGLNLAKAFYVAEELGITEKIHHPMFTAIHVNGLKMNQQDLLVRLFEGRGETAAEEFQAAFDGFNVENRIRRSDTLVRGWRIEGTPAMVVDGRYIAGGTHARTKQQILAIVDFLVAKVLDERRAQRETGS